MTKEFSASTRADLIAAQRSQPFDLLVVGGGITGTCIAWDAALRGLRVALVERQDFGSGTSSRSSRLVHGGLRYLEQMAFSLVFEGTHERRVLMDIAPHLVKPLAFVVPTYKGDRNPRWKIDLGLWLYDLLAGRKGIGWHERFTADGMLAEEPALKREDLTGGLRYWDCASDDARLTLMAARTAYEAGAVPVSRVEFVHPVYDEGLVSGALLRDLLSGAEYTLRTRTIFSAAGPFTDQVLATFPGDNPPMLRPSKGVHLVVPHSRLPVRHAVVMNAPQDRRVTFCVPWREATYLGTTDTEFDGDPASPDVTASDVAYMLEVVQKYYPGCNLTAADVVGTWSGIRPLVGQDKSSTYNVSREHTIAELPGGAFTIAGGKLTTCRKMAEEAVDRVLAWLRGQGDERRFLACKTAEGRFVSGEDLTLEGLAPHRRALEEQFGLSTFAADHFQKVYGNGAEAVLSRCASSSDGLTPIVAGLPYTWGEVEEAVRADMTLTLEDFLARRTHLLHKTSDQGASVEVAVADRMGALLGWDAARREENLAWYRSLRAAAVAFRVA